MVNKLPAFSRQPNNLLAQIIICSNPFISFGLFGFLAES